MALRSARRQRCCWLLVASSEPSESNRIGANLQQQQVALLPLLHLPLPLATCSWAAATASAAQKLQLPRCRLANFPPTDWPPTLASPLLEAAAAKAALERNNSKHYAVARSELESSAHLLRLLAVATTAQVEVPLSAVAGSNLLLLQKFARSRDGARFALPCERRRQQRRRSSTSGVCVFVRSLRQPQEASRNLFGRSTGLMVEKLHSILRNGNSRVAGAQC